MKLTQCLEMLTLYSYNMKVIHWNSTGKHFDDIHALADKYHAMINGTIDAVGEIIGMLDGTIPSFRDLVNDLSDSEKDFLVIDGSREQTLETGVIHIEHMLNDITAMITSILDELEDDIALAGIKSELESVQFMYAKEATYFNKRRMG